MASAKKIRVSQTKSSNGRLQSHKDTLRGLGLRRIRHSVELNDTPEIRGMINKIAYMVKVED
ncbi:MAG: 50S ribosomal protein L30 [Pseudomonadota bacterium]